MINQHILLLMKSKHCQITKMCSTNTAPFINRWLRRKIKEPHIDLNMFYVVTRKDHWQIASRTYSLPSFLTPRTYSLQSFFHPGHIPSPHFPIPDIFPPVVFPSGTYSLPSFFHPIHFFSGLYIHVTCATKSEIKHLIDLTQIETILMFCTEIKLFVIIIENDHHLSKLIFNNYHKSDIIKLPTKN